MLVAGLAPAPPALIAERLTKRYVAGIPGCRAAVSALSGLSLEVASGELVALVGAAGSGKSTLLLCAAGLLRPDSGSLRWFGSAQLPRTRTCYARRVRDLREARHERRDDANLWLLDINLGSITARERLGIESVVRDAICGGESVVLCARSVQALPDVDCRTVFLERGVVAPRLDVASSAVVSSNRVAEASGCVG